MHFVRACCVRGPTPRGRAPFLGLSGLRALGLVWRAASRMRPSLAPCMMVGPSWAAILKGAGRGGYPLRGCTRLGAQAPGPLAGGLGVPAGTGAPAGAGPTINGSSPLLPCWEPHCSTASRVCARRSRPATHPAGGHIRKPPASSPAAALRRAVPLFCVGPALDCAVLLRHCPTGQKGVQRHVYRNHSRRSRHPRQLHLRTPAIPTRKSQPRPRTSRSTQAIPR